MPPALHTLLRTGEYVHSPFFSEQLQAFQVWLEQGSDRKRVRVVCWPLPGAQAHPPALTLSHALCPGATQPPEQLPIVLQVLLSQSHRLRALRLLAQFLDMGPWAVNLALSVGIFPYVLKLLQSPAAELRQVLVHIWAKIMIVDRYGSTSNEKEGWAKERCG